MPTLHCITLTCNTEIRENSRQFIIHFAVADIKYNILGTPFFEKNIQSIDIQNLTMQFTQAHQTCPNNTKFTTITEKDYPFVSYIYMITSKEAIHFPPNTGKTVHFPINNYSKLHFTTLNNKKIFPSIPHTYFFI